MILHALRYLKPVTVFECEVNWVNSSLSMMCLCLKQVGKNQKTQNNYLPPFQDVFRMNLIVLFALIRCFYQRKSILAPMIITSVQFVWQILKSLSVLSDVKTFQILLQHEEYLLKELLKCYFFQVIKN
jgi:hypothetical protein